MYETYLHTRNLHTPALTHSLHTLPRAETHSHLQSLCTPAHVCPMHRAMHTNTCMSRTRICTWPCEPTCVHAQCPHQTCTCIHCYAHEHLHEDTELCTPAYLWAYGAMHTSTHREAVHTSTHMHVATHTSTHMWAQCHAHHHTCVQTEPHTPAPTHGHTALHTRTCAQHTHSAVHPSTYVCTQCHAHQCPQLCKSAQFCAHSAKHTDALQHTCAHSATHTSARRALHTSTVLCSRCQAHQHAYVQTEPCTPAHAELRTLTCHTRVPTPTGAGGIGAAATPPSAAR